MVSSSKFEFWDELPNEMRTECIKRMDFKSRMRLRVTSKQDKSLIDSAPKYHFDRVIAELNVNYVPRVSCKNLPRLELNFEKELGPAAPEFFEEAYQRLAHVLKFANPKTVDFALKFTTDEAASEFLADISNYTPFRFKNVILNCEKFEIIDFFLKNCNSLESISLKCGTFNEAKIMEIINSPIVINVKVVQLLDFASSEIPCLLIKKWIEKKDLDVGKELQIRIYNENFRDSLGEKFENRVVSKTDKTLRIRTNNPAKHVLIRSLRNPDWTEYRTIYFSFLVIPSHQRESEYKKDDQWATVVYEKEEARSRAQLRARSAWYWATGIEEDVELSDRGDEEDEEDEESWDDFY